MSPGNATGGRGQTLDYRIKRSKQPKTERGVFVAQRTLESLHRGPFGFCSLTVHSIHYPREGHSYLFSVWLDVSPCEQLGFPIPPDRGKKGRRGCKDTGRTWPGTAQCLSFPRIRLPSPEQVVCVRMLPLCRLVRL
jgi:hypothetical protein